MQIAKERLLQERKVSDYLSKLFYNWRKEHPFGFTARPLTSEDGETQDLFRWECKIPGKANVIFFLD